MNNKPLALDSQYFIATSKNMATFAKTNIGKNCHTNADILIYPIFFVHL